MEEETTLPRTAIAHCESEERLMHTSPLHLGNDFPSTDDPCERLESAVRAMREGRPVILVDDACRENEADLIFAAERITEPMMALMIRECSGIVCLCLPEARLRELELPQMVARNESRNGTAFTVSIDAKDGVTTGVSASDRVATIRAAIAKEASPCDLVRPGHVFPLCANADGVLGRAGHTEGSVDLAVLSGLGPAAVLCELMNADGTMMRGAQLEALSRKRGYPILSVEELIAHRKRTNSEKSRLSVLAEAQVR